MAVLVTPDGTEPKYVHLSSRDDDDDNDRAYGDIERILGRGAERLDLSDWVNFAFDMPPIRYWYAYLSRDRFIMKQPFNKRASELLGTTVFGNVIFASANEVGQMPFREKELQKKEKEEQAKLYAIERQKQALERAKKKRRDKVLWWVKGFVAGLLVALGEAIIVWTAMQVLDVYGFIKIL